jgi:tRNA-dihydrouridine synthase B
MTLYKEVDIGGLRTKGNVFLAPMAGVTDLPFRSLCRRFGASYAVGEMAASKNDLQSTEKTRLRYVFDGEEAPRAIQLIGADPRDLAQAAKKAVRAGAQIVDLNCGCPAKKVCSVDCGSALLRQPELIRELLRALIDATDAPVTLKYRAGWSPEEINACEIAEMAQKEGVSLLVLHGRTRAGGYTEPVDYEIIRKVKSISNIPVIANGDITSGAKAAHVLEYTSADGVMIGRGAFGNPWIFQEITAYLEGREFSIPSGGEILRTVLEHQKAHMDFYGEAVGVRSFRKHLLWYLNRLTENPEMQNAARAICQLKTYAQQKEALEEFFKKLFDL